MSLPRPERLLLLGLLPMVVQLTLDLLLQPMEALIGDMPDDAFFYLVIARNLARGLGFTFDGLLGTSGFHAPWLILSAGLVSLSGPDRLELLPRLFVAMHGLFALAASWLFGRFLLDIGLDLGRALLGMLLVGMAAVASFGVGMEMPLVQLCLWGLMLAWRRPLPWLQAALSAALVLCRLDMAPLLLTGILLLKRRSWPSLVGGLMGAACVLAFNTLIAGEPFSTSMSLKGLGGLSWRLPRLDAELVYRHVSILALVGLVPTIYGLIRRVFRADPWPWVLLSVALLHISLELLLNNLVGPWYYQPLAWTLIATGLASLVGLRAPWLLLAGAVYFLRLSPPPGDGLHPTVQRFARGLALQVPPGQTILAEDFAGILAWYSDRPIFPADGLVASPSYRAALVEGRALEPAHEAGIRWYAVTRRRESWLETLPHVDRVQPYFLPVPPTMVDLGEQDPLLVEIDPRSRRLFALFRLPARTVSP